MSNCCQRKPQSARGAKRIPKRLASLVLLNRHYSMCRHQRRSSPDGIKRSMVKIADEAYQKGYDEARIKVDLDAYHRGRQEMEPLAERRGYERGLAEAGALVEREQEPHQCNIDDTEVQLEEARLQGMAEAIHAMELLNAEEHIQALSTTLGFPVIRFVGMKYHGGHVFHPSDIVRLEKEYKSEHGNPALRVLVRKNGRMVKVAYVLSVDAAVLKKIAGFENTPLEYHCTTGTGLTTSYRILFPGELFFPTVHIILCTVHLPLILIGFSVHLP